MKKLAMAWMIFILVPITAATQSHPFNQKVHDPKSGKEILIGYCTRDSLQGTLFREHFNKEYSAYQPAGDVMNDLAEKAEILKSVHVTIVMGTWCSDSQQQVPRFFKLTDNLQYISNITIICVDQEKRAGDVSLEGMNIVKVPTFIFERKGREIGRIVETPKSSLEQDLNTILLK